MTDIVSMTGNSSQIGILSALMRQAEIRHQVISNNIANVNTPGYQALEVSFDDALLQAVERGEAQPEQLEGTLSHTPGLTIRRDGNNVDMDREMGQLTKNTMHFETYAQILASKMAMLRSAITGQ